MLLLVVQACHKPRYIAEFFRYNVQAGVCESTHNQRKDTVIVFGVPLSAHFAHILAYDRERTDILCCDDIEPQFAVFLNFQTVYAVFRTLFRTSLKYLAI